MASSEGSVIPISVHFFRTFGCNLWVQPDRIGSYTCPEGRRLIWSLVRKIRFARQLDICEIWSQTLHEGVPAWSRMLQTNTPH